MTVKITVQGLEKAISAYEKKGKNVSSAIELAVKRVAIMLRDSATQMAHAGHPDHPNVISGRLSNSIRFDVTPNSKKGATARVGSDADYAPSVEYGHSQTPGRFVPALGKRLVASSVRPFPFMRPAVTEVFDSGKAQRVYENTIKEALNA